jgi:hypothetical protein
VLWRLGVLRVVVVIKRGGSLLCVVCTLFGVFWVFCVLLGFLFGLCVSQVSFGKWDACPVCVLPWYLGGSCRRYVCLPGFETQLVGSVSGWVREVCCRVCLCTPGVPLGCWCPASSAQPCRELEGNLSCSFFFLTNRGY